MLELERRGDAEQGRMLQEEAAVLRKLELPGLPVVVDVIDEHGEVTLTTGVPPGMPLRDRAPLAVPIAAGVVLALASLARQLRDAGVGRRPFSLDQVHLAGGSRPMLRHLAGAAMGTQPAHPDAGAADLGRILLTILPRRRHPRWALGPDRDAELRRLAHRAADPAMTLDRFAALVREAVPDAMLPSPPNTGQAGERGTPRRLLAVAGSAGILLLCAAAGGLALARSEGRVPTTERPPTEPSARQAPTTTARVAAVWPRHGCPPTSGDVLERDDECPLDATIEGSVIRAGSRSWAVGGVGTYAVAIADWSCDRQADVAALDLDTGEVWLFERMPEAGQHITAQRVGTASHAVDFAPAAGCGPLQPVNEAGVPVRLAGQNGTLG